MSKVDRSAFINPSLEGFEGLSGFGGLLGAGFLIPGNGYRIRSMLISGLATTGLSQDQAVIGDFNKGDAGWGILNSGYIAAALGGTAYLGANNDGPGFSITLDNDALRVGGYLVGAPGGIVVKAYDRFNALVETQSISSGTVATWGSNFIGLEQVNGIKRIVVQGSYVALDNFIFEGGSTPPPTPPAVSIVGAGKLEGNSGSSTLFLTINLDKASAQTVTLDYATSNGTATAGSDYTAAAGTVTFNPGETSKAIAISVLGDTLYEPNETFTVTLSNATRATIATATATGTITNDDIPPISISTSSVSKAEGNSGSSPLTFTVTLNQASAQAGSDYTATSGTLTFNAGETSKAIAVAVLGDTRYEANETFTLTLSSPTNATIATTTATGTINNDDSRPTITIGSVSQGEGNSGNAPMSFAVSLSNASDEVVSVNYASTNGTASAGSDYTASAGTLTFNAGETSKAIAVAVLGDTLYEGNETFNLTLSNAVNSTIATATATGTILNDDADPIPAISITGDTKAENAEAVVFTVNLSKAYAGTVSVNYATVNGSATAGSDYYGSTGTLTFNAGETSKAIAISLINDLAFEGTETFTLNLSSPTNATFSSSSAVATILNDDRAEPDFNGDSKADIVWREAGGTNYAWLMNGGSQSGGLNLPSVVGTEWKIDATGDFNGDSKADLVWRNYANGIVYIWLMNGSQILSINLVTTLNDSNWHIDAAGDFNSDSNDDLVWRNHATGENYIWTMSGTAVQSIVQIDTVNAPWQLEGAGDFNGDGKADLVWRNYGDGMVYVWFMNGTSYASSAYVTTFNDPIWHIDGVGDLNSDGKADLLWRSHSSGDNYVWLMDGVSIAGSSYIGNVGMNWEAVI